MDILVEEPSAHDMLVVLLPIIVRNRAIHCRVIDLQSKSTLLKRLPDRMCGYANTPGAPRVIVMVDRDDDDCRVLKAELEKAAQSARLCTKTRPGAGGSYTVVNRVVIEELEAWFFGDVPALASAYPGVPSSLGEQARYRDPDAIKGGTWEALERVLNAAGHYRETGLFPKREVARRVAREMEVRRNRSRSFQSFIAGFEALVAA